MFEGKRPGEHVQIPERRTHCITDAETVVWCHGCPPMVTLMLHVACMYTATAVVVRHFKC